MENASLYPLKCGFCAHANPADSRYCNACGAPLRVQPCPHCGTVNDSTAAICQECEAPLADGGPNEFFLPLPPDGSARGEAARVPATAGAVPHAAAPVDDFVLLAEPGEIPAEPRRRDETEVRAPAAIASSEAVATLLHTEAASPDPEPTPQPAAAPVEVAPAVSVQDAPDPQPAAPIADTASGTPERGGRGLKTVIALIALGIAVYFGYRHFQRFDPSDAASRPATTSVGKDLLAPAPTEKAVATPAPTAAPGAASKAAAADGAGGKGGHGVEPARAAPAQPAPTDIFITKPESSPAPAPETRQAASTQGAVRRPATPSAACTDAVAALGLCKPENTQGRKP